jgi:hypothetical protein
MRQALKEDSRQAEEDLHLWYDWMLEFEDKADYWKQISLGSQQVLKDTMANCLKEGLTLSVLVSEGFFTQSNLNTFA